MQINFNRYWIEQIDGSGEGAKPIFVVGTHIDKLPKGERKSLIAKMNSNYSASQKKANGSQFEGHFEVDLSEKRGTGQNALKSKLIDTALNHPVLGINKVKVPRNFVLLCNELANLKKSTPFIYWREYFQIAQLIGMTERATFLNLTWITVGIDEHHIEEFSKLLHDTGNIVWHNVPKLRNIVVINPQWFADAMAGVVSFMCQKAFAKHRGMVDWVKIKESLQLWYALSFVHYLV